MMKKITYQLYPDAEGLEKYQILEDMDGGHVTANKVHAFCLCADSHTCEIWAQIVNEYAWYDTTYICLARIIRANDSAHAKREMLRQAAAWLSERNLIAIPQTVAPEYCLDCGEGIESICWKWCPTCGSEINNLRISFRPTFDNEREIELVF